MDLITIKFIGIILLFHTTDLPNPIKYTVLVPDGDGHPAIAKCHKPLDIHKAYIRVIGPTENGTTWPKADDCTASADCKLYELDHDELLITSVTESGNGVTQLDSVGKIVPPLKDFFKSVGNDIDLDIAKMRSNAFFELNAGTLEGGWEINDMRTATLVVKQGITHLPTVTIKSNTRPNLRIVVPAGAHIAILNLPPHIAKDDPGNHYVPGHEDHWFLHYALANHEPKASDCKAPPSAPYLLKQYKDHHNHPTALNKACSATTYP